jgi:hypothetical protein
VIPYVDEIDSAEKSSNIAAFESWVENDERDPAPPGMAGALELYRNGS